MTRKQPNPWCVLHAMGFFLATLAGEGCDTFEKYRALKARYLQDADREVVDRAKETGGNKDKDED